MYTKVCLVPECPNTTVKSPDKSFFMLPSQIKRRKLWLKAMRYTNDLTPNAIRYVCQDHFNLEEDSDNYIKFKFFGGKLALKRTSVPTRFDCQSDRKTAHSIPPRPAVEKRERQRYIEDAMAEVKKLEEQAVKRCLVPDCGRTSDNRSDVLLFKVPEAESERKKWEQSLNLIPRYYQSICEYHLSLEDIVLQKVHYTNMKTKQLITAVQVVQLKEHAIPTRTIRSGACIMKSFYSHKFESIFVDVKIEHPLFTELFSDLCAISLPTSWVKIIPKNSDFVVFATFSCTEFSKMSPYKEVHINSEGLIKYLCYGREVVIDLDPKLSSVENLQTALYSFDSYELCEKQEVKMEPNEDCVLVEVDPFAVKQEPCY